MLRFFRQIRQKLLENGNLRKYFWYALGEILLVVIGILIALQINNWNEQRKEAERAQLAVYSLYEESEKIVQYFNDQVTLLEDFIIDVDKTAKALHTGKLDDLKPEEIALTVGFYPSPTPPRTVYDELINSGQFKEIRNDSVKLKVTKYYQELNFLEGQLGYFRNLTEDLQEYANNGIVSVYDSTNSRRRSYQYNFELLVGNDTFKQKHVNELRNLIQFQRFRIGTQEAAIDMCKELAHALGKTCESADMD